MKKTGITVEVTQELLNNGFTHAAPVPASTGRQRIYQVQFVGEYASSIWHDATEDAYNTFMPERRRIVYAAPVAARELDVEAEPARFKAYLAELHPDAPPTGWDCWLAAKRDLIAAQSAAPVSTEQAGDAWRSIETAPRDGSQVILSNGVNVVQGWFVSDTKVGTEVIHDTEGRYVDEIYHEGYQGWMDHEGGMQPDPTHWMPLPAAPSPNNSPVGADKEQPQ